MLFDLPEEDCYKYCIRQRAKTPEKLIEIKYEKPKNMVCLCSNAVLCRSNPDGGWPAMWFKIRQRSLSTRNELHRELLLLVTHFAYSFVVTACAAVELWYLFPWRLVWSL